MNPVAKPYVALPDFYLLTDQHLQYLDVLVYTALKWHNKSSDDKCFPRHETVAALAGLSKRFVIKSIARLEAAGIIRVERNEKKRKSNYYYFAPPHRNSHLEKIPKTFFEDTRELTKHERAMLLCIRHFFHHGFATYADSKPAAFFAKWLGLSEDTVDKQFRGLIKKGFIKWEYKILKYEDKCYIRYKLTDKIDWNFESYNLKPQVLNNKELIIS